MKPRQGFIYKFFEHGIKNELAKFHRSSSTVFNSVQHTDEEPVRYAPSENTLILHPLRMLLDCFQALYNKVKMATYFGVCFLHCAGTNSNS